MFYNDFTGQIFAENGGLYIMDEKRTANGDLQRKENLEIFMTNEEYRAEIQTMINNVDSNHLLHYFYILLSRIIGKRH